MTAPRLTEDDLREGLRTIAEWGRPVTVPPLPTVAVARLDVGHVQHARPRPSAAWWASAAALLVVLAVIAATLTRTSAPPPLAKGTWEAMARAPIPARSMPAAVWTGHSVVIIGGQAADGTYLQDAAAYYPGEDEWRRLPDPPAAVSPGATALWTGEEVVVVSGRRVELTEPRSSSEDRLPFPMAYDPVRETWRMLPAPPDFVEVAGFAAGRLVALAWGDDNRHFPVAYDERGWEQGGPLPGAPVGGVRDWEVLVVGDRVVFIARDWVAFRVGRHTPIGFVIDSVTLRSEPILRPPVVERPAEEGITTTVAAQVAASTDGTVLFVGRTVDDDGETEDVAATYDIYERRWTEAPTPSPLPADEEAFRGMSVTGLSGAIALVGGFHGNGSLIGEGERIKHNAGGVRALYAVDRNRWFDLPAPPIDLDRAGHVTVWTDTSLVVWGGLFQRSGASNRLDTPADDGAVYQPPRRRPSWSTD